MLKTMPDVFQIDGVALYLVAAPPVYDPVGRGGFIREMPDGAPSQTMASLETEAAKRGAVVVTVQGDLW